MLKQIFLWNRIPLWRIFLLFFLSLQLIIACAMLYSYSADESSFQGENSFVFTMFFLMPLTSCVFVFILVFLGLIYNQYLRNKAYNLYPFNELKTIGFIEGVSKNKWKENHNYLNGMINNYVVDFDIYKEYYGKLVFRFYIKEELMDQDEFDKVFNGFSEYKAIYNGDSVDLCFHRKKHGFSTFLEFRNELTSFAEYLKKSKLKPELLEDIRR